MKARLIFLGTGTSSGVPQLKCSCHVCRSSDPRDHRRRSAAILAVESGPNILIDAGPDLLSQLRDAGSPDLDAVLITHSHYDHVAGLDELRPYSYELLDGFPMVCSDDVEEHLRTRIPYCFHLEPIPGLPCLRPVRAEDFKTVSISGIDILPLPIIHSAGPRIFAYRIGRFAYVTDCKEMPEATVEALRGVDTLVVNALRHTLHPTHMNLRQALDVIHSIAPRRAFLTHASHGIGLHAETSRLLPEGVALAYDGLTIDLEI